MTYKLLPDGRVRLDDGYCAQVLTLDEFDRYMIPFRESDPDYYAQLVSIRVRMPDPLPL